MAKQKQQDQQAASPAGASVQGGPDFLSAVISDGDKATVNIPAGRKTFASGRSGWWGQAKIVVGGRSYQAQVQVVEIRKEA